MPKPGSWATTGTVLSIGIDRIIPASGWKSKYLKEAKY
jgi:hypothetical protein